MKCICHEHKPECDCCVETDYKPERAIFYVFWALLLGIFIILAAIFLSSRPAEASRGDFGELVQHCCRGVHPRSGTSYRTIALVLQSQARPVFETGTASVGYVLQWPQLPSVADQFIKAARDRLADVMVATADAKNEPRRHRALVERRRLSIATGMACFFGGLLLVIALWPYRKE